MNYQVLLVAALIGITVAAQCGSPCPEDSDSSKCDCCPDPCCCRCVGNNTIKPKPKICRKFIDLALVIDSSGSIGTSDWAAGKTFIKDIVGLLSEVGGEAQRVAGIYYSTNATLAWNLDSPETSSLPNLEEAIDDLPLVQQFTNTVESLELVVSSVFNGQGGDSPDRANFLLIITDGRSNFRIQNRAAVAAQAKAVAEVAVIGVTTEIDMAELQIYASNPSSIFTVQNFKALENKLLNEIAFKVCPEDVPEPVEDCYCCCPPPPPSYHHNPYNY